MIARVRRTLRHWGTTEAERSEHYSCDDFIDSTDLTLFRAVSVAAPQRIACRWLAQMRVAPYSYDLVDNFGHRSPRTADPALESLEVGQPFMGMFTLAAFEPGRSITLDTGRSWYGRVVVTYRVTAVPDAGCRLVAKLVTDLAPSVAGRLLRLVLPLGDLVMMRKQLLTLKTLAEKDAVIESADGATRSQRRSPSEENTTETI
jgi:hypothetical protein